MSLLNVNLESYLFFRGELKAGVTATSKALLAFPGPWPWCHDHGTQLQVPFKKLEGTACDVSDIRA